MTDIACSPGAFSLHSGRPVATELADMLRQLATSRPVASLLA
ncbi:hypothetical protein [Fibrivirga algicola]|nr:hypothetical protein [Fibrivirga algicola]